MSPPLQVQFSASDESQLREEFDRAEADVDVSTREQSEKMVAELGEVFAARRSGRLHFHRDRQHHRTAVSLLVEEASDGVLHLRIHHTPLRDVVGPL